MFPTFSSLTSPMKRVSCLALALLACTGLAAEPDSELAFDPATFDPATPVCEDPYLHVNARWLETAPIPPGYPAWGPRLAVVERNRQQQRAIAERAAARLAAGQAQGDEALVGAFFASGMDVAGIDAAGLAPIADLLAGIDAIDSRQALLDYLATTASQGVDLVFGYYVWPRHDDPGRHILYLEEGGRALADRDRYLGDDASSLVLRTAYRDYLRELLALSGLPAHDAQAGADAAFALEQSLARASLSTEAWDDPANYFNVRSLAEIQQLTPGIDWAAFLARMGHDEATQVSLAQPEFFRTLDRHVAETPLAEWRAYLRARVLDTMAPYLAGSYRERHFALHQTAQRGVAQQPERGKQVLDVFNNTGTIGMSAIGMAMSRLYIAEHLPADARPRAQAMVDDLRAAFRARIERAVWMDEGSRRAALDKLERMGAKLGYPDRWPSLDGLAFDPHAYAGNVRAAWRFAHEHMNARLDQPVDNGEWRVGLPHEINARYNWDSNEIYFPAPMLQAPAFDLRQDPALNYAVLGVIIGHEMTHGFDSLGARFDANGRLRDWWSGDDRHKFEALGKRVAQRYGTERSESGLAVDGTLTLTENIADLGGLAIAYDALQRRLAASPVAPIDGLDQDRRFFLRYATIWRTRSSPQFEQLRLKTDTHAPERLRARVPLSDQPQFAAAFGCKAGDAMWRADADRVGIW